MSQTWFEQKQLATKQGFVPFLEYKHAGITFVEQVFHRFQCPKHD